MTSRKTRPTKPTNVLCWLSAPAMLAALFAGCWTRGLPAVEPLPASGGSSPTASGGAGGSSPTASGGAEGDPLNEPPLGNPGQVATVPNKLDLLLMVDDSSSMAPLQTKLTAELPNLLSGLRDPTTGQYPDLHFGVVSSSMGGGAWGNVNQCAFGVHPGDDGALLQQGPGGAGSGTCTMLHAGQKFLANGDGTTSAPPNFDGDIGSAVQCMALLGDNGCGFESQLKAIVYALKKAADPLDPDNGGFLRPEARLAIVMLTNEDDCSVADDSLLLDPAVNSATDPTGLGALQSYRCNEFGHLCGGQPPPHGYDFPTSTFNLPTGTYRSAAGPGTGGVVLNGCVSADGNGKTDPMVAAPDGTSDPSMGHLYASVSTLIASIKSFKSNPADVLVAAIAGPTTDADGSSLYRVFAQTNPAAMNELDPVVDHSCVQATASDPEYADPAVRIKQLVDGFGANGIFYPICANDFSAAEQGLATGIKAMITR